MMEMIRHITAVPSKDDRERASPPAPGIIVDGRLFTSGQCSYDDAGKLMGKGDFPAQAERCLEKIADIVNRAGGSMDRTIKLIVYVTLPLSRDILRQLGGIWARRFGCAMPACTIVQIEALIDPAFLIEIEAVSILEKVDVGGANA